MNPKEVTVLLSDINIYSTAIPSMQKPSLLFTLQVPRAPKQPFQSEEKRPREKGHHMNHLKEPTQFLNKKALGRSSMSMRVTWIKRVVNRIDSYRHIDNSMNNNNNKT